MYIYIYIYIYIVDLMDTDERYREKARQKLYKNAMSYIEQIQEAISHKTTVVWPPTAYL